MKKTYLIPTIKTMRMAEPLMDATVSNSEIGPGFEEGAKGMDLEGEDTEFFQIKTKSVWED